MGGGGGGVSVSVTLTATVCQLAFSFPSDRFSLVLVKGSSLVLQIGNYSGIDNFRNDCKMTRNKFLNTVVIFI